MCYASVVMVWIGAAVVTWLSSRVVTHWTGVAALGRLGHALSLAIAVGAVVVVATSAPVDCRALCLAVDIGLYSWWWAFAVGCWC